MDLYRTLTAQMQAVIDVGGVNIKTEFRNIFSLRSANVEISQENVKMSVKGSPASV